MKKKRVPSFVLMMTSRGSNTKACILYAFECGEYGHRIELCPKQNQPFPLPEAENSPAAKAQTRIRKSGRNKGLSDLGCYLPTDVAREISHVVSLRIRDHKIANTQKEKEGHVAKPRKAV